MSVCAIGVDEFCSGCLRTLDEIARWAAMSADEQWSVMAHLAHRRVQRDGARPIER
jgi:predicted Fe-S protein YdhL (DUF1289 family)